MALKARRYLRPGNAGLAEFITNDLHYLDYDETLAFYREFLARKPLEQDFALLGCNDRYFLLTHQLKRPDALHPWLFDRCRMVEDKPDGYLDLWARYHYKSTFITFAGSIQEILIDPEITIGMFSHTRPIAQQFLRQDKREFETNRELIEQYPDVLWYNPKTEAPMWSEAEGICVKRQGNPKEQTIEAWGLTDGQPTSKHFRLLLYDDVVTRKSVTNADQIAKTTEAWEHSDNLGTPEGARKWHSGTRYSFADTYGVLMDRKSLIPRVYPATVDGKPDGEPVYMTKARLNEVRRDQASTFSAQMLQNPSAGLERMFQTSWLKSYDVRPTMLNVYIMGDPANSKKKDSDRTAIPVIGVDVHSNKYLLDGVRHRMNLTERWAALRTLYRRWVNMPGVQAVWVGWERYGLQSDHDYFEEKMRESKGDESIYFDIAELNWTRDGTESKNDRVGRLVPDFEEGNFFLPKYVWHADFHSRASWEIDEGTHEIIYKDAQNVTRTEKAYKFNDEEHRLARPIRRRDEENRVYDLTRAFFEEYMFFPFSKKVDLIDAMSRIYDMDVLPPVSFEQSRVEVIELPD